MPADPKKENALETALRLAATDPAQRPAFEKCLLGAMVHVLGTAEVDPKTGRTIVGSKIALQHWTRSDGLPMIPVFTSKEVLAASLERGAKMLTLPMAALAELTRGRHLALNPRSTHAVWLTPEDVARMLTTHGPR